MNIIGALIEHLAPGTRESIAGGLLAFLDGQFTRRNVVRAADETIDDPKTPKRDAEFMRECRADFIKSFDCIRNPDLPAEDLRSAALTAVGLAFVIGGTDHGQEVAEEMTRRARQNSARGGLAGARTKRANAEARWRNHARGLAVKWNQKRNTPNGLAGYIYNKWEVTNPPNGYVPSLSSLGKLMAEMARAGEISFTK